MRSFKKVQEALSRGEIVYMEDRHKEKVLKIWNNEVPNPSGWFKVRVREKGRGEAYDVHPDTNVVFDTRMDGTTVTKEYYDTY